MLSIVLGQCNWKENHISFGSSCSAREFRSNDLIRIDRDKIRDLELKNDYYTEYQQMLDNVIRSKIDVDRIRFDFYGGGREFLTVRDALFQMHGMFLGKQDIYFDLLDYGIPAINNIISVSQRRPILTTLSWCNCYELNDIYVTRKEKIMRKELPEINLYVNEMRIVPAVLRYLCRLSVGTKFSVRQTVKDSLGLSEADIDEGVSIFSGYIRNCIDYQIINSTVWDLSSLSTKLVRGEEMTMDYDMKRSWAMLKEVTKYFLGIHKEVGSHIGLSRVPCKVDLRRAPERADSLSILSRTSAQIPAGDFQRRYVSQYILNGDQPMKNFIQGIALGKSFKGGIIDIVKNTTVISHAKKDRRGKVTLAQIDGSDVRVCTMYDMFSVKTPFGDGSLAWQDRVPVECKNGKPVLEVKNPASLVTVRSNGTAWIRPTYASIFNVLDRESIKNKMLVAEVMKEFLNIPMPELQEGIDEGEKNRLLKEHIDHNIDRIKEANRNIEQLSPQTLQSATDLALIQMYCEPHNSKPHKTAGKQERAFIELVLYYCSLGYNRPFADAFKAYIPGCQNGINRTASVIDGKERDSSRLFEGVSYSTIMEDRKNLALLDDFMSDTDD